MKKHAESLPKLERLVDTVQRLSLARDIKDVMRIVRTVARQLTGADGATFVLRDGSLCYYADEDAISPLWKGGRFPMKSCISGWVMMNRKPAVIKDIYADKRIPVDAYRPTFVKSLAMVPIRTVKPIGAIGNYWSKHRQPTTEEVTVLQALADITAVSIENIEVRNALKSKLSERASMLRQLTAQKSQLEEFMYIIAHNLRAPLSNLLLLGDMLRKKADDEKMIGYLDKQRTVVEFLNETFSELVDAIHVKSDFSVQRDHIELDTAVQKAVALLEGEINLSGASISTDFSRAKTAYFPQKYMDSILLNLLGNALKYRSAQRQPDIRITSYKKSGWTWFEVKDNGLGIDLDKHGSKIFMLRQTFHGLPNAKGFGLFITKTQLEAMGGTIEVKSKPERGSTFIVKLNKNK